MGVNRPEQQLDHGQSMTQNQTHILKLGKMQKDLGQKALGQKKLAYSLYSKLDYICA